MSILPLSSLLATAALLTLMLSLAHSQRQEKNRNVFQAISRVINKEKLKQRIIRGLNLNLTASQPSPRELAPEQSAGKIVLLNASGEQRLLPKRTVLRVHASTTDAPASPNEVRFTLDARVLSIANRITETKLVVHLWGDRKRKRGGGGRKRRRPRRKMRTAAAGVRRGEGGPSSGGSETMQRSKGRAKTRDAKDSSILPDDVLLSHSAESMRARIKQGLRRASRLSGTSRKSRPAPRRMGRRKKPGRDRRRRVKVMVHAQRPNSRRMRRVAWGSVRVRRAGWKSKATVALNISNDLITQALATPEHTLTLQISCKRCGRHTHIDRVLTAEEGEEKRDPPTRWLNPYRPYLFIVADEKVEAPRERSRRDLTAFYSPRCSRFDDVNVLFGRPWEKIRPAPCCSERVWVSFEELGLGGLVLYPSGFYTDVCKGTCSLSGPDTPILASTPPEHPAPTVLPPNSPPPPSPPPTFPTPPGSVLTPTMEVADSVYFDKPRKQRQSTNYRPLLTSQRLSTSRGRLRRDSGLPDTGRLPHVTSRLFRKPASHCAPLSARPLKIWYINPSTYEIIPKEIPDLIKESCGCAL